MRPSKSRSRSKANRPRPLGNIVNRVFDSSGPEGKVRGTPQQIIDKYLVLARDAQLSNDRVAAENFLQHAEHYTRMLNEAQREMAREAEARRDGGRDHPGRDNGGRDGARDGARDGGREMAREGGRDGGQPDARAPQAHGQPQPRGESHGFAPAAARDDAAAAGDMPAEDSGVGLVDTPEARAEARGDARAEGGEGPPRARQKPRKPVRTAAPAEAPAATEAPEAGVDPETPSDEPAGDKPAPRRRAPRRPRGSARDAAGGDVKSSAAE